MRQDRQMRRQENYIILINKYLKGQTQTLHKKAKTKKPKQPTTPPISF
jgi:hypothetical protein